MSIFCLGVNHKTAPVEIRERLAIRSSVLPAELKSICQNRWIDEIVLLSTCNRVELYGASPSSENAFEHLIAYLVDHFDVKGHAVDFYRYEDREAALHLFDVASGLDSMVLGETEIFGQVKNAYAVAQQNGVTGKRLNKLFQQSFAVGKRVRSNSKIQQGSTSVGAVAVDVAEKMIFGELDGCKVMIIGAGEMSRTTAQSFLSRGASSLIVSNRSYDAAQELAEQLGGRAMRFDDWETALPEVDIVIGATAAPHTVIQAEAVRKHVRKRRGRPLYFIDIAVPRDFDEEIRSIEDVFLFNIDQLQTMADRGRARRLEQVEICRGLIAAYVEEKGIAALQPIPGNKDRGSDGSAADSSGQPLTNPGS